MTTEITILLCLIAGGGLAFKWWTDKRYHEAQSEFFRKHLDKQIENRDADILDAARTVKETLDEYYKRRAEVLASRRDAANKPDDKG